MRIRLLICTFITICNGLFAQNLRSPEMFLNYKAGERFSYHHQVVAYFKYVADNSNKVKLIEYGETSEHRPLIAMVVSSADNITHLEEIRKNNMVVTGLEKEILTDRQKVIVWLNYNIHGNESVSTESSMNVLYELITNPEKENWLNDAVVIIDPCVNPDGRDRYVNWYNQTLGVSPNLNATSWEHNEPWPGGRFNHYLFDLNRDWAWQTQKESQERMALYHNWFPHIHVDFHEMGAESSYFFAPAAKPLHKDITPWQREFQTLIGKNHATYFDKAGWSYYTKETFDLFYPSYGDTYPVFQGAIGFTYEQGGSGKAGLSIGLPNGQALTLKDRIDHHTTTSFSTIETAFKYKEELLRQFKLFFDQARNSPKGDYKAYVIKHTNNIDRIKALTSLLDKQKIEYYHPSNSSKASGFDYLNNKENSFSLDKKDIVISAYQPQSQLLKVLFEPKPVLEDSLTYDLTSWALPLAYNMEVYAVKNKIAINEKPVKLENDTNKVNPLIKYYAYLIEWKDVSDAELLTKLYQEGISVRVAQESFTYRDRIFDAGTLIILQADNNAIGFNQVQMLAKMYQQEVYAVETGLMNEGKDLGSDHIALLTPPKIALLAGNDVSPTHFGELWHFFENDLNYTVDIIRTDYISRVNLNLYQIVILPDGDYEDYQKQLISFTGNGGRLIALNGAVETFAEHDTTILHKETEKVKKKEEEAKKDKEVSPEKKLQKYGEAEREALKKTVAGAIYEVSLDDTHPLAFGLGKKMFMVKTNDVPYPYLSEKCWNVGAYKDKAHISGFIGSETKEKMKNTLAIGIEPFGKGEFVYLPDAPAFRAFWHSGKLLLSNAIFMKW